MSPQARFENQFFEAAIAPAAADEVHKRATVAENDIPSL